MPRWAAEYLAAFRTAAGSRVAAGADAARRNRQNSAQDFNPVTLPRSHPDRQIFLCQPVGAKAESSRKREGLIFQDERSHQTNTEEPNHLNKHVRRGVNRGEAIPIPIGNIGRDRGEQATR